jgi:hypothetical protein
MRQIIKFYCVHMYTCMSIDQNVLSIACVHMYVYTTWYKIHCIFFIKLHVLLL